jgi:hypothetical protein
VAPTPSLTKATWSVPKKFYSRVNRFLTPTGNIKMYRLADAASPATKAKAQPKAKLRGKAKAKSKVPLFESLEIESLTVRPCLWAGSS